MRAAAIDIGTNSVLLLVAEGDPGAPRVLADRATITRLGQGVDRSRRLAPDAVARTLGCLADYARQLAELQVDRVAMVGTSAMRDAAGGRELAEGAREIVGVELRVVPGAEEAELSFAGATSGLALQGAITVFDVGGGSTEIVSGVVGGGVRRIDRAGSLDVGSVRLTERHVRSDPPTADQVARIRAEVRASLAELARPSSGTPVVGVAGTVTTLAAVLDAIDPYDGAAVHGRVLERGVVEALLDRLAALPLSERQRLKGLEPLRADVIVAGACIVTEVLDWARAGSTVVSDRGLRWGLIEQLLVR